MTDQVLSIEQMKEIMELDVDTSNASMYWEDKKLNIAICNLDYLALDRDIVPAFTLQDILEMLPTHKTFSEYNKTYNRCWVRLCSPENDNIHTELSNESLLEASFKMLKWCKQNNFI